jgi:hypothetical protein
MPTAGLRAKLRYFTRPTTVLNRMWSLSVSTQTGVTCGLPSASIVPTCASWAYRHALRRLKVTEQPEV